MSKDGEQPRAGASLAEEVYVLLLDEITEGRWRSDETLSAYGLSGRLGVSRTPVVEALKRLEAEGLIEIIPRVGARLRHRGPEATEELFAVLSALLGLAAERAAERADEPWLARQDELVDRLGRARERGAETEYRRLIGEFHRNLINVGLPAHAVVAERLLRLMRAEALMNRRMTFVRQATVGELEAIVDAVRAASPLRARAATELHIATASVVLHGVRGASARIRPMEGLEHSALLYRSKDELIASALPFILAGIQRGEPVLVASTPDNLDMFASALGADSRRVDYRDSADWCDDRASTLRRFREYLQDHATAPRVRFVAEPPWGDRSEVEVGEWLQFESLINVAFDADPASIVCPYDAVRLSQRILGGAAAAHPHLCAAGGITPSPEYQPFFSAGAG